MSAVEVAGPANYRKEEKLGEGTYGVVFKAVNTVTGRVVALKQIRMDSNDEGIPSTTIREIAVLKDLKHNNIVELIEVVSVGSVLYLAFEFMDQDLRHYMDRNREPILNPQLVKSYLYQILMGLCYCHSRRIIHRDLKPQNLLIDKGGNIKLADFGLARAFSIPLRPYTHEIVTLWYRAPEVLLGQQSYSTPVDIWSVGAIFAEMLSKKPIFPGDSEFDQIMKTFQVLGTPSEAVWEGVTTLPYWKPTFPNWRPKDLHTLYPQASRDAIDLLSVNTTQRKSSHT